MDDAANGSKVLSDEDTDEVAGGNTELAADFDVFAGCDANGSDFVANGSFANGSLAKLLPLAGAAGRGSAKGSECLFAAKLGDCILNCPLPLLPRLENESRPLLELYEGRRSLESLLFTVSPYLPTYLLPEVSLPPKVLLLLLASSR